MLSLFRRLYLIYVHVDRISKDFSGRMPLQFLRLLMFRTFLLRIGVSTSVFPR